MSTESNIILITDDNDVINILKPKLILLREIDNLLVANYSEAITNIEKIIPETIIIYCSDNKDDCIKLIQSIKSYEKNKNLPIILVIKNYEQDFVLSAYDEGISDYFSLNADDVEILMRTLWCLKKNSYITALKKQNRLLESLGVIDETTGFYTNEYCEKIFENELRNLKLTNAEGILMFISASEESKTKLNPLLLAKAIRTSTRASDVLVNGSANRFYVLLGLTQLKGAFCVWDKIKRALGEQYTIIAGISSIEDKTFDELKKDLLKALVEASSLNKDLIIVNEEEQVSSDQWLKKISSTQKNFKLFKQAFNKKLEKVITPVFFQMQKLYEDKLFNTHIEQYSNSTLSAFVLKSQDNLSELKITYPGFSKINIDIIHQGLDSPENRNISLDLTEIEESKLTKILEDFIAEFKSSEN